MHCLLTGFSSGLLFKAALELGEVQVCNILPGREDSRVSGWKWILTQDLKSLGPVTQLCFCPAVGVGVLWGEQATAKATLLPPYRRQHPRLSEKPCPHGFENLRNSTEAKGLITIKANEYILANTLYFLLTNKIVFFSSIFRPTVSYCSILRWECTEHLHLATYQGRTGPQAWKGPASSCR